jgi:ferredoxin-NADP reductase
MNLCRRQNKMANIKKYKAQIIDIKQIDNKIFTLFIQSFDKPFKYSPGQFLHLALDEYDPSGPWPDSRCFSILTSPENKILKITFTVKGAFTSRMANELNIGSLVYIKLPFGELFTQYHNKKHTIFLAGGTGITPFISLFNDITFSEYYNPKLYAGFRNIFMNIFLHELDRAKQINPSFVLKFYYENTNGLINIDAVLKDDNRENTFFISGPPAMINYFSQTLQTNGINKHRIKTDLWE